MSEQELVAKEKQNAVEIYRKFGDDEQKLSQAVWNDLKKIGSNSDLECMPQTRHDVEKAFLEQLSKVSHDQHKKVYVEFSNPYDNTKHDKQHTLIGTSRGYMKDGESCDMKPLDYPIKVSAPARPGASTPADLTMTSGWKHSAGPESFNIYDQGRKK